MISADIDALSDALEQALDAEAWEQIQQVAQVVDAQLRAVLPVESAVLKGEEQGQLLNSLDRLASLYKRAIAEVGSARAATRQQINELNQRKKQTHQYLDIAAGRGG